MEIQEPSPRLLISGLRYETVSPWLLDKRGELIAHFSKKYELPDWNAQQDVVQFYTKDARTLFQLSVREVYVSIENFEDLAEATDSAQKARTARPAHRRPRQSTGRWSGARAGSCSNDETYASSSSTRTVSIDASTSPNRYVR